MIDLYEFLDPFPSEPEMKCRKIRHFLIWFEKDTLDLGHWTLPLNCGMKQQLLALEQSPSMIGTTKVLTNLPTSWLDKLFLSNVLVL